MQFVPNSNKLGFMWRYNLEEHTCSCKNYKASHRNWNSWSEPWAEAINSIFRNCAESRFGWYRHFCMTKHSDQYTQEPKSVHLLLFLTMSGPQVVPSAAGMNLVSHRCPTRWHQSDLQMSCQTNQTNEKVVYNQRVSPPLDADTQGVLNRTAQSIQQNRSNSVKGAHSSTTHWLGPADERNADVVFDLVLGEHGRHLEEL